MACRLQAGGTVGGEEHWAQQDCDIFSAPEVIYVVSTYEPPLHLTSASHCLAGLAFWVVDPQLALAGPRPS